MAPKPNHRKQGQRSGNLEAVHACDEGDDHRADNWSIFSDPAVVLTTLLANSGDPTLVCDKQCTPRFFNAAYARMVAKAFAVEMKPGLRPHEMVANPETAAYWDGLRRRALAGECFRTKVNDRFPDNDIRNREIGFIPIIANGCVEGFIEVVRDTRVHDELKQQLIERERVKLAFSNSATDLLVLVDRKGFIIEANEAFCKKFDKKPESINRFRIWDLLPPEEVTTIERYGQQVVATGKSVRFEEKLSGTWFDTLFFPLPDNEEKILKIGIIARDITERKLAQMRMQQRESLIRSIGNNLPNCMLYQIVRTADGERRFTYVSEAVRRFYNCSPAEAMADAKRIYGMVAKEDQQRVYEEEEKAFRQLCTFSTETRVVNPDGGLRWSYFASSPSLLEDGVTCWDGIEIDISERKCIENNLRLLFEESPVGILVADDRGDRFLKANPAICRMLGYTEAELLRMGIVDIHPAEALQSVFDAFERQKKGEITLAPALACIRKDGVVIYADISTSPIFMDGRMVLVGFFSEITARKKAEDALQQANEELEKRVKERTEALEMQKSVLEQVNAALNVLLKKRDEDKLMIEESVLFNAKEIVEPMIVRLKNSGLKQDQAAFANAIESGLQDIVSPFSLSLHSKYLGLTLSEIRVANLVKEGKTTKEIASLLNSTSRAISFHRQNLRKKLGLGNRRANLGSYLLSLPK